MSMREKATLLMRANILKGIQESKHGMTQLELADIFGVNYYTIRNYVIELEASGLIQIADYRREKSVVYIAPDHNNMPKLAGVPIIAYLREQASNKHEVALGPNGKSAPYANIYRVLLHNTTNLFNLAKSKDSGGKVSIEELTIIKRKTRANLERLEAMVMVHKIMLENPNLWDPAEFHKVLLGNDMTPVTHDEIGKIYTTLNQVIHENQGRI